MIEISNKIGEEFLPNTSAILGEGSKLLLDPEHTVNTVNEQDQNEDEGGDDYIIEIAKEVKKKTHLEILMQEMMAMMTIIMFFLGD